MKPRYLISALSAAFTLWALVMLICARATGPETRATVYATLFVGFLAADVVLWQGYLIKRQLAFSTYLELDREWNSEDMVEARKAVHAPKSEE